MRRSRSPVSSPFRALAHHQPPTVPGDPFSLIRSYIVEANPARPIRPSPLTASTIRDMPLDLVDRLRSFPLFQSAPEDFLVEIGNHLKPQVQAANDHVVTEGDDAKAMYWLIRGVVAVTSRDGEAVYAELKSGAFFGEIGVLMDMPRTATIVARTKCLLLILKKEDLHRIMPMFPQMEQAIREEAQERLTLLRKKKHQQGGSPPSSTTGDLGARTAVPGEVSRGDSGILKDGTIINTKKRKSPGPGMIEDPAVGSAIGSGYVNIRKTLRELPLFTNLPSEILHFLGLSAQPKIYTPFKDIVKQGTRGSEIFFIVQGEAEVIHPSSKHASSKEMLIPKRPRLKAGQYFGEVSSLGLSQERTATVRSITTVECLMIPGDALNELWRQCPAELKAQVEETARIRLSTKSEDVAMMDTDEKIASAHSDPPTPCTPNRSQSPHITLTVATNSVSPSKDDSDHMEPKDPDPFLSVDLENLRNRRRQSLAPPTSTTDASYRVSNGLASPDGTTLKFAFSQTSLDSDVPTKRAKTSASSRGSPACILSDAILVRIFAYFDIVDLLRLRLINSHWRRVITTHQDVCRNVDLSNYNRRVTDQVLAQIVAPFIGTRARAVNLNNCFHVSDSGFSALWKTCGKNVRCWKMRSVWDVSASQILDMSENAKELREIDWSNCRKVGDNLLGRVVGWVVPEHPPTLQRKVMAQPNGKFIRSRHPVEAAKEKSPPPGTVIGCPKLDTLNLSYCKHITDRSMAHLAGHASDRIRSLSLTRCTSITDAGFQSWAQHKFEKLTHLCLADCTYLSDHAIVALVNAAKSLTHLDLSFCCALTDTATEVVALGLPKLRELRLAFCGSAVSDASLQTIALHLPELEGLSVRGCVRVTGRGVESLVKECTLLKWLDVSQCRNLEPWLRAGGPMRWNPDNQGRNAWSSDEDDETAEFGLSNSGSQVMSVGRLTSTSSFARRSKLGMARRRRHAVHFIVEKGPVGLR